MKKCSHNSQNDDGMSLVEVVVALLLVSIMATMLQSAIAYGITSRDALAIKANEQARWIAAERSVRMLIERIWPTREPDSDFLMEGTNASMEFFADLPPAVSKGGLHKVSLGIRDGALMATFYPWPYNERGAFSERRTVQLINGVGSVKFAFGIVRGNTLSWQEEWSDKLLLPAAIRIRVVPERSGDEKELVVSPRLSSRPQ